MSISVIRQKESYTDADSAEKVASRFAEEEVMESEGKIEFPPSTSLGWPFKAAAPDSAEKRPSVVEGAADSVVSISVPPASSMSSS